MTPRRCVVLVALVVAFTLAQARPMHRVINHQRELLQLEKEVLSVSDLPLPVLVRLGNLEGGLPSGQRQEKSHRGVLRDLEAVGGTAMKDTQWEKDALQTLWLHLLHQKYSSQPETIPSQLKYAFTHNKPRELPQRTHSGFLFKRLYNMAFQEDYAKLSVGDALPEIFKKVFMDNLGPLISTGEGMDQFLELARDSCAYEDEIPSLKAFQMASSSKGISVQDLSQAIAKQFKTRDQALSKDLQNKIEEMVRKLDYKFDPRKVGQEGEGDGHISACEYTRAYIVDRMTDKLPTEIGKKGCLFPPEGVDFDAFKDWIGKPPVVVEKNDADDALLKTAFRLWDLSSYFDPEGPPTAPGKEEIKGKLDACEFQLAYFNLQQNDGNPRSGWSDDEIFLREPDNDLEKLFSFTSKSAVGTSPEMSFRGFERMMKVIDLGNHACVSEEGGNTHCFFNMLTLPNSLDDSDDADLADTLFNAIVERQDGSTEEAKITLNELTAFLKNLCENSELEVTPGDHVNRKVVEVLRDYSRSYNYKISRQEFRHALNGFANLVHGVTSDQIERAIKALTNGDPGQLTKRQFAGVMALLMKFGSRLESPAGANEKIPNEAKFPELDVSCPEMSFEAFVVEVAHKTKFRTRYGFEVHSDLSSDDETNRCTPEDVNDSQRDSEEKKPPCSKELFEKFIAEPATQAYARDNNIEPPLMKDFDPAKFDWHCGVRIALRCKADSAVAQNPAVHCEAPPATGTQRNKDECRFTIRGSCGMAAECTPAAFVDFLSTEDTKRKIKSAYASVPTANAWPQDGGCSHEIPLACARDKDNGAVKIACEPDDSGRCRFVVKGSCRECACECESLEKLFGSYNRWFQKQLGGGRGAPGFKVTCQKDEHGTLRGQLQCVANDMAVAFGVVSLTSTSVEVSCDFNAGAESADCAAYKVGDTITVANSDTAVAIHKKINCAVCIAPPASGYKAGTTATGNWVNWKVPPDGCLQGKTKDATCMVSCPCLESPVYLPCDGEQRKAAFGDAIDVAVYHYNEPEEKCPVVDVLPSCKLSTEESKKVFEAVKLTPTILKTEDSGRNCNAKATVACMSSFTTDDMGAVVKNDGTAVEKRVVSCDRSNAVKSYQGPVLCKKDFENGKDMCSWQVDLGCIEKACKISDIPSLPAGTNLGPECAGKEWIMPGQHCALACESPAQTLAPSDAKLTCQRPQCIGAENCANPEIPENDRRSAWSEVPRVKCERRLQGGSSESKPDSDCHQYQLQVCPVASANSAAGNIMLGKIEADKQPCHTSEFAESDYCFDKCCHMTSAIENIPKNIKGHFIAESKELNYLSGRLQFPCKWLANNQNAKYGANCKLRVPELKHAETKKDFYSGTEKESENRKNSTRDLVGDLMADAMAHKYLCCDRSRGQGNHPRNWLINCGDFRYWSEGVLTPTNSQERSRERADYARFHMDVSPFKNGNLQQPQFDISRQPVRRKAALFAMGISLNNDSKLMSYSKNEEYKKKARWALLAKIMPEPITPQNVDYPDKVERPQPNAHVCPSGFYREGYSGEGNKWHTPCALTKEDMDDFNESQWAKKNRYEVKLCTAQCCEPPPAAQTE